MKSSWVLSPIERSQGSDWMTMRSEHGLTLYLFSSREKADNFLKVRRTASQWHPQEISHDDLSIRGGFGAVWIDESGEYPDGELLPFRNFVMQKG